MANLGKKLVAVTGTAGFIGSHLIDALAFERPQKTILEDNFICQQAIDRIDWAKRSLTPYKIRHKLLNWGR